MSCRTRTTFHDLASHDDVHDKAYTALLRSTRTHLLYKS